MDDTVLVSREWLQQHLTDPNVRIFDARVSDPRLPMGYRMGHIPGAVPFDLNTDVYEMTDTGPAIKPFEAIGKTLGERGVSNDSTIVIYDEETGQLAATIFWLLKYLGHRDVRVLHGGWYAWQQANCPSTRDLPNPQPVPYSVQADDAQNGTAEWILQNGTNPDVLLLDVRSDTEFGMGHIPGATNLPFDEAMDYATHMLKDTQVLKHQFELAGVTPDKDIVTYCASGARSSHTYLVLKALGYPRVRNYKGSMRDWAQLRRLPIE